jgi:hypothetical protein
VSRCLLHKTKLEPFKAWLSGQGIEHRPGRGDYQILQVLTKNGQWQCIFDRNVAPEHYTVAEPIEYMVRRFIQSGRSAPTTK